MHIAIVGTGANGAAIAADLLAAGVEVTLIDPWPANVEAIRDNGIVVETPDETRVVPAQAHHACQVAELHGRLFDVVLIVVKAYDTAWVSELIRPLLAPDGVVVGVQNGMTIPTISEALGESRTAGCVIEIAAAMWRPGIVERHTPSSGTWFGVGDPTATNPQNAERVAQVLASAGAVQIVPDIFSAKWMKLVVNSAELVSSAILDLPLLEAAKQPGMHEFMLATGQEAMSAALASGAEVVPIFGFEEVDRSDPAAFAERMLNAVYTSWSLPHTTTTVLQDWRKGRRSEVQQLNGYVLQTARRAGMDAPFNQRVVEVARAIESGELPRDLTNLSRLLG